ncbi:sialin [Plakobranchus ocellatus]|uniref:Sialin n=1 Tax=Plakobranchus ocellatus TaxID=259542 RepID=A0AAV4C8M1_9GAST|nr:sialin [Plakobranchus ocellatus]
MFDKGFVPETTSDVQKDSHGKDVDISKKEKRVVSFQEPEKTAPRLLGSTRLALSLIACVGFLNLYALRVNLSVAMVCMVNQTALDLMKDADQDGSGEVKQRPGTCNGEQDDFTNNTTGDDKVKYCFSNKKFQPQHLPFGTPAVVSLALPLLFHHH